eukprot:tig00001333_g8181.t1
MVGITGTVTSTGLLNANGFLNVMANKFVVDMSGNVLATGAVASRAPSPRRAAERAGGGGVHVAAERPGDGHGRHHGHGHLDGLLNANGFLNVMANKFVVDMSGNVLATGAVGITGTVTSTGLLNVLGAAVFTSLVNANAA